MHHYFINIMHALLIIIFACISISSFFHFFMYNYVRQISLESMLRIIPSKPVTYQQCLSPQNGENTKI